MKSEEIKEKYGIQPIMKEMWVWDSDYKLARVEFVLYSLYDEGYYFAILTPNKTSIFWYMNASETNPNDKEPKVGDKGYFWDDERYYVCDVLDDIINTRSLTNINKFHSSFCGDFKHFSHNKQTWMK